ncbi:MAG TPA: MFS transporter [Candidatus Dormibacteraeota bacterium]|nr:MFS transporter [Candidatus Dormibacteraeota bacterium]
MPEEKLRSLRALDLLNFCNAGIQTGLGPFMSIFYTAVRHWDPGQIGTLIACQALAGIGVQSFVGHWVDESHHKRLITAAAGLTVAAGAVGIVTLPTFGLQILMQIVIGLAVTVFPAVTAAFALGMVEEGQLSGRIARNETFTHSGNVMFAIAAGAIGTLLALQGIFYAAAIFATGMAISVYFIEQSHVNYEAARAGAGGGESNTKRASTRDLFRDKRILTFAAGVVLFYFANAATLPLVGEILTQGKHGRRSAWQVAASVVVAEVLMVVVAILCGKLADKWGRKRLFLIGFGFLVLRNALTVVSHNEYYLISLQSLDGIAMGIYGVLLTLITADLAKGTGRFNLLQGAVQSSMGLGGVLSNSLFGWIAKSFGFNVSFLGLAAVGVVGGVLWQFKMPETKPDDTEPQQNQPPPEPQHDRAQPARAG